MRYGTCFLLVIVAATGCGPVVRHNLPPSQQIMGPGPGVTGPGPGVMQYPRPPAPVAIQTSQIHFAGPDGMNVQWDVSAPGLFDSEALVVPGRYNFPQGAIYRLKLTNIPGRPGVELYPSLEVGLAQPRTAAFLAHNAIPIQFTNEDFDQVLSGNFVTKVIYLPDPEFQELAVAGVETLVSTRLDPGVDPIVEADRRGAILAIVRIGNKDLHAGGAGGTGGYIIGPNGLPCPAPGIAGGPMLPNGYVSGVSGPQWGMPMSGTPIGLPGPPYIPLGAPAGLQKYTIEDHTHMHIPAPTDKVRVDVQQKPGYNYPAPANVVKIHENTTMGPEVYRQPGSEAHQLIAGAPPAPAAVAPCPPPANGGGTPQN